MRILLYSHNNRGLGHANRSVALAWAFHRCLPSSSVVHCGGCLYDLTTLLPPNADYLKLPSYDVQRGGGGVRTVAARLQVSAQELSTIRRSVLSALAQSYRPDVLIADFYPEGKRGELRDVIAGLRARQKTLLYLGYRDILDADEKARATIAHDAKAIGRFDRVFVYGDSDVFDFAAHYDLPVDIRGRTEHVGYVVNAAGESRDGDTIRHELGVSSGQRLVLASVGGGKDSEAVLNVIIEAALATADDARLHWCIVTGPLIRSTQWERTATAVGGRPITLLRYVPKLIDLMAVCDLFVGSFGYNLAAEVAATGTPAVLIPILCSDEQEQTTRARIFRERGLCLTLDVGPDAPARLASLVRLTPRAGERARGLPAAVRVHGADAVAARVRADWEALGRAQDQSGESFRRRPQEQGQ